MKHHLFRTLAAGFVAVVLARGSMGAAGDILLRAADAPVIHGTWAVITDASAAGGTRLGNPDQGVPKPASPLASPSSYVELTFEAAAGSQTAPTVDFNAS